VGLLVPCGRPGQIPDELNPMNKKTVRDVDVQGSRVLVRVDFNVPLAEGQVSDDTRIQAALPTLQYLLEQGATLVLCSHLGRPKGKVVDELKMDPVAQRLSELLGRPVTKLDDCVGPEVQAAVLAGEPGDVFLLENTRFHAEEKSNDPAFAEQLASLGELYVNDAFGTAHRAHASTVGVTHHLPAVAGFLIEMELEYLGGALSAPEHPFVAILGGAKISDKIGVIENLLEQVDALLVGGGMANTFLKADGYDVAESLVEDNSLDTARALIERAGNTLVMPVDVSPSPRCRMAGVSSTSVRAPWSCSKNGWPAPGPSCGTGRWACSNSPSSPRAPRRWPACWPRCPTPQPSSAVVTRQQPSSAPVWPTR